ncbi:MAG: FHA domain-containing protein [Fuerstiella sp.]|nr:FHA domain-containing protein [Fuerstiella sp.]
MIITTEGDVRVSGQFTTGDAVAWIGVASPSAPHRLESLVAGTFHIGRSKTCHLRLGDDSIPDLLAVIVADRINARISCQSSSPPVLLNGEPVQDAALSDGDLLEAGPYSLVFQRLRSGAASSNLTDDHTVNESRATAAELVNALEEELAVVEELDHSQTQGWQEMATRLVQEDLKHSEMSQRRDVIPIDDMHSLLVKLEKGQQDLRLQQESILQQLSELRQLQSRLAESLLPASESVVSIRSTTPLPTRRASA